MYPSTDPKHHTSKQNRNKRILVQASSVPQEATTLQKHMQRKTQHFKEGGDGKVFEIIVVVLPYFKLKHDTIDILQETNNLT